MKKIEKLIEDALSAETSFKLNQDFKNKVVQAIRKKERRAQRRIYLWMAFGILFMFFMGYGSLRFYFPDLLQNINQGQELNSLVPIAVIVGILVVIIQFLDQRLVKDQMLSH